MGCFSIGRRRRTRAKKPGEQLLTSPQADAQGHSYRPDIDGLRALAILSVVLYHGGLIRISGGFTGVDIFFVISGYLIGGQICAEIRTGAFSFAGFYRRRARRILPAFFAVLAFVLAAGLVLLSPLDLTRMARSACAAAVSVSNILFWHSASYFDTRSDLNPLLMTWSLGVEEQFYAVIPLLLVLVFRIRRNRIVSAVLIVSALSFLFSWIALADHPALVFYMLPARAWELGIGVALAAAEQNRQRELVPSAWRQGLGFSGMLLLLAPFFLLTSTTPFPGPAAVLSVVGTALLLAVPSSWINRRALSFGPLVFIGRISYSWYLWHWPLLSFLHIVYGGTPPGLAALAAIALSFVLAIMSYYLIEQPFRRSRRSALPLLIRYAIATAVVAAISAALWLSRGVPQRFPALARIESDAAHLQSDPCLADIGDDTPNLSTACVQEAAPLQVALMPQVVALWGDSHAAALAPAFRSLAQTQGYALAEFTKASCPPVLGVSHFISRHPSLAAECVAYNQRVFDRLMRDSRIHVVILSASWPGYLHRNWQDGWLVTDAAHTSEMPPENTVRAALAGSLSATVRALTSAGKQVFVFDDIPAFDFEPAWRLDSTAIPARRALAALLHVSNVADTGAAAPQDADSRHTASAAAASALLQQALAAQPTITLVNLHSSLCNSQAQCLYRNGDQLLYSDNNHLSPAGARYALRDFRLPPAAAQIPAPEPAR
jgi:peptidoglycan/LPS O-acetylase OafA/YrhL